MKIDELVQAAMTAKELDSYRQLADQLGVTHTAIGKWLDGSQLPTFETAAHLADLAGLDPVSTAASIRLQSKDAAKNRGILRRLATAAAALTLALILPAPSQALEAHRNAVAAFGHESAPVYIMSSLAALWRVLCGFSPTSRRDVSRFPGRAPFWMVPLPV